MSVFHALRCDDPSCSVTVELAAVDPYDRAIRRGWAIVFEGNHAGSTRHFCVKHGPERDHGGWMHKDEMRTRR